MNGRTSKLCRRIARTYVSAKGQARTAKALRRGGHALKRFAIMTTLLLSCASIDPETGIVQDAGLIVAPDAAAPDLTSTPADVLTSPDLGIDTGTDIARLDGASLLPDLSVIVDVFTPDVRPAQPDISAPEAGREAGPEVAKLSFPSCTYGTQPVSIVKAGVYCGRYPQLGPNGTIMCYTGCKIEKVNGVLTTATNVDPTAGGYCMSAVDDSSTSGSTNTRAGLCFDSAATCTTVCAP